MDNFQKILHEIKEIFSKAGPRLLAKAIVSVFLLCTLYFVILYFVQGWGLPKDIRNELNKIDSLTRVLREEQNRFDSVITRQENYVKELDDKLKSIREKTTVIKQYYMDQQSQAEKYTPTQVDSFFQKRYSY